MFHPSKRRYKGGNYTDAPLLSTNLYKYTDENSIIKGIISDTNIIPYIAVLNQSKTEADLTSTYHSTLSTISASVASLEAEFREKTTLANKSYTDKATAYGNYIRTGQIYDDYKTAYLASTIYYSSLLYDLSTLTGEDSAMLTRYYNLSTFGDLDAMSTFLGYVGISTSRGYEIEYILEKIYKYNTSVIPSSISSLDGYSSAYVTDRNAYLEEEDRINTANVTIKTNNDKIKTFREQKEPYDARILANAQQYTVKKGLLQIDNNTQKYLSSYGAVVSTYMMYTSTLNTMHEIENLYNMVINGVQLSGDFIDAIGVQQGGYTPMYQVTPLVCDPNDTTCITNRDFLSKYLSVYFSLSTVLPIYKAAYENSNQIYRAALGTATAINSDIIDTLSGYDVQLKTALNTVQSLTPVYMERIERRVKLNTMYHSPRVQISTSAFTLREREQLLSGIQSGGDLPVEDSATGTITIPKSNYSDATINSIYTSSISTYQGIVKINDTKYTIVNNNYISTVLAYQIVDATNETKRSMRAGVDNQILGCRAILAANIDSLSSLRFQSTILGNTALTYNTNIVENTADKLAKSLLQINTVLTVFQQSTISMCAAMHTQFQNELKAYLATICQISTLVLFDTATKHLNNVRGTGDLPIGTTDPTRDPKIRTLYGFLDESHKYVSILFSEELKKTEYIKTKLIYDIESSNRLNQTDPAQIMNSADFALLTLRYDAYIQEVNNMIEYRSTFNKHYVREFNSIKTTLEPSTRIRITDPVGIIHNNRQENISSLFPYDMTFNYIEHKSNLFTLGKLLPTTTIPICEPSMIDDGTPRTTTTIETPTTTAVGRVYGVLCQYIHITRADNNIEIMQIIAVDRYGKNHVFNASISLFPNSFTGNTSHIKNGNYSVTQARNNPLRPVNLNDYLLSSSNLSEPKIVRINLGRMIDITGITYVKRNASYSSRGITISLYDNEYKPVTVPERYYNYTPSANTLAGANWSEIKTPGLATFFTQQTSGASRSSTINEAKLKCVSMEDCLGIQFESSSQTWITGKGSIANAGGFSDYVYSLSYNSQPLGQPLPSNTMQILSDFPSTTFDLRLSTTDLTSKIINNPSRYGVCGIMGRYVMLSFNSLTPWLPSPNSGGKFYTQSTSVPFSASTGTPAENQAAAKAACVSMADCVGIQNVGGNNTWITGKGTLLTDQNTGDYVLIPPYYYYSLSQITVVAPDGRNLASGAGIHTSMSASNPVSILTNGKYNSLPLSQSFVYSTATKNDYIIIDLGTEKEISAVNLYYATGDSPTNQNNAAVTILTEDNMVAAVRETSKYHTTISKEIIDFTFEGAPKCYTSVKWPSYYGPAGIISRYVRIERNGPLAFSKLEVIDKTGVDVAQFKFAFASSNQNRAIIPVSSMNPSTGRPIAKSYASENNGNQYYYVDLGVEKEICAINVYNCIDVDYLGGATISIRNINNDATSALTEFRMENGKQIHRFDTRYEPSTSQLPTTVKKSLTRYGSYGIYTEEVHVYSITTATVTIVDAAGLSIGISPGVSIQCTVSTGSYTSNGLNLTVYKYRLPRLYEITSVIVNNSNVNQIVQLYDCYNILVGQARASTPTPANNIQMGYCADFRNLWNGYPNIFAPLVPYNSKRGGYDLAYFNHITSASNTYTRTTNYSNTGIKARYVKIIPADNTTPLHISQILVVDEFGINRAYNAETYYQTATPQTLATPQTSQTPATEAIQIPPGSTLLGTTETTTICQIIDTNGNIYIGTNPIANYGFPMIVYNIQNNSFSRFPYAAMGNSAFSLAFRNGNLYIAGPPSNYATTYLITFSSTGASPSIIQNPYNTLNTFYPFSHNIQTSPSTSGTNGIFHNYCYTSIDSAGYLFILYQFDRNDNNGWQGTKYENRITIIPPPGIQPIGYNDYRIDKYPTSQVILLGNCTNSSMTGYYTSNDMKLNKINFQKVNNIMAYGYEESIYTYTEDIKAICFDSTSTHIYAAGQRLIYKYPISDTSVSSIPKIVYHYPKVEGTTIGISLYLNKLYYTHNNGNVYSYLLTETATVPPATVPPATPDSSNSYFPPSAKNMVDGIYEAEFDSPEFLRLFFEKYRRKEDNLVESYISATPAITPSATSFIPSPFTLIDIGLDTKTPLEARDSTKGKEYSINSVIYVASKGKGREAVGVIIQLLNDVGDVVGSQMVTRMTEIFGVDILDFRADPTVSIETLPTMIEVRPRMIKVGTCGIMTQYIRIEQIDPMKPIQISQVIVTDTNGNNVAAFKPTFASYNQSKSYNIVDGKYHTKLLTNAYSSSDTPITTPLYNQFIEINLEREYELMSIQVAEIFGGSSGFNTLRARTLNASRDVIASQSVHVPQAIMSTLGAVDTGTGSLTYAPLDTSNFLYLSKIGVQIAQNLSAYKFQTGGVVASAITTFSTITGIPQLLAGPEENNCPSASAIYVPSIPYTRKDNGIPTKYVRVYNVNNYIQISQLMAYDSSGVNWAYKKSCTATSTLPHCYAAYAVDGKGGFFHQARPEPQCFISGNNKYDFWEVDLGALYNIIAVRYIPPSTKSIRNIGTRVQLLDQNRVVLSQLIVETFGEVVLDFRDTVSPPIAQAIMPPITTLYQVQNAFIGGISAYSGTIAFVNLNNKSTSNLNLNTLVATQNISNFVYNAYVNVISLFYDTTASKLLTLDYASNKITARNYTNNVNDTIIDSGNPTNTSRGIDKPYYMNKNNGLYYMCENRIDGYLYSFTNITPGAGVNLRHLYTMDNMCAFDFDSAGNIYICSVNRVVKLSPTGEYRLLFAAPSGATYNIPLISISGIAIDKVNNVFYISDVETNIVYALHNNTYTIVAGTGEVGYSGHGRQGPLARLNGPYFLQFMDGILYISDKYNGAIRIINFQTVDSASISSTTTNVPQFMTTTIEYGTPETTASGTITTYIAPPKTNDTYIVNIIPDTVSETNLAVGHITAFTISYFDNYLYVCNNINLNINTIIKYSENLTAASTDFFGHSTTASNLNVVNTYSLTGYGQIKSMTAYSSQIIYFTSTTHNGIYSLNISNTGSTPTLYMGMTTNNNYTPDGTLYTSASIKPETVYFNTFDNALYFTEIRSVGLVRKVNLSNRIQTVVGLNRSDVRTVNTLEYYSFISDFIKPITNPAAITLINPCAIVNDINGNLYIADSATFSIHRLTPYGALEPVCGPFRLRPSSEGYNIGTSSNANIITGVIPFVSQVAQNGVYQYAYSVKINSPTSLTFDSNMDLICTSYDGCQIIKISNLERFEPTVEIISGLGTDVNNISQYSSKMYIGKYASLQYPNFITYSYKTNSFYFANKSGTNTSVIKNLSNTLNFVLFKGNNGILPYGLVNKITTATGILYDYIICDSYDSIYYINNTGIYRKYDTLNRKLNSTVLNNPKGICLYNQMYLYYINTGNNTIEYIDISLITNNMQQLLASVVVSLAIPDNNLVNAKHLTVHENGCMWVSYPGSIKMLYLKARALILNEISIGTQTLTSYGPIFVDSINNCLYITLGSGDTKISTVKKYELSFEYSSVINPNMNISSFISSNITAITCDADGNVFYSDGSNIYRIPRNVAESTSAISDSVRTTINEGRNTSNSNITYMAYCNSSVYLVINNKVKYMSLTSSGTSTPFSVDLRTSAGTPYPFSSISSVYHDGTNIYVADRGANSIYVFNGDDIYVKTYSTSSLSPPVGLVVNEGIIYFTTMTNNNIYSIIHSTSTTPPAITVFCNILNATGVINKLVINSNNIYAMDTRQIYKITFSSVVTTVYNETLQINTFSVFNNSYYFSTNAILKSFTMNSTCSYNLKKTWLIEKYNGVMFAENSVNIVSIASNGDLVYCAANCSYENVSYSYVFVLSQSGDANTPGIYNIACGSPLHKSPSETPSPVLMTKIVSPIKALTFSKSGLHYSDNQHIYNISNRQILNKNKIYKVAGYPFNSSNVIQGYSKLVSTSDSTTSQVTGDYALASQATFSLPSVSLCDSNGNIYVGDGNKVRRIDAVTGIITTVATITNAISNQNDIIDLQIDRMKALCILTSKAVYRCTPTLNANEYGTPALIAGGGIIYQNDVQAVNVSFTNCRTMRFDSIGNLYVVDSVPVILRLSDNVISSASDVDAIKANLKAKANSLYGKEEPSQSDMVPPYNMTNTNHNDRLAHKDYVYQFQLFGSSNGTITGTLGTSSNPYTGSALSNDIAAQSTIDQCLAKVETYNAILALVNADIAKFVTINQIFLNAPNDYSKLIGADQYYNRNTPLLSNGNTGNLYYLSSDDTIIRNFLYTTNRVDNREINVYRIQMNYNTAYDTTLRDLMKTYEDKYLLLYFFYYDNVTDARTIDGPILLSGPNDGIHVETHGFAQFNTHVLQQYNNWGYSYKNKTVTKAFGYTTVTYHNDGTIARAIPLFNACSTAATAIKTYLQSNPAQAALNTAYSARYGVTRVEPTPTRECTLKTYNDLMNLRYGNNLSKDSYNRYIVPNIATVTSGSLFDYNAGVVLHQAADAALTAAIRTLSPTTQQTNNAVRQRASFIRKIGLNGTITTHASGMVECVGIAFDSNDNLYVADHYSNNIYLLNSDTIGFSNDISGNRQDFINKECLINTGAAKPFGIAVDSNNNVYISCNNYEIRYKDLDNTCGGNIILKCSSSNRKLTNLTAFTAGSLTSAVVLPSPNIVNENVNLAIVENPGLLSIDSNNRLCFVQYKPKINDTTGLYSVYMIPLDLTSTSVTVGSIKIQPSVRGKGVYIDSISIGDAYIASSNATFLNHLGAVSIPAGSNSLNYTSSTSETNPYLLITFNTPKQIGIIIFKSNNNNSVGMNVLLYDVAGKLISSRKTTNEIISPTGCVFNYDTITQSKS